VVEILGRTVGDLHEPRTCGGRHAVLEEPNEDFTGMVTTGEEEDDAPNIGLEENARGIDARPHSLARLADEFQRGDLRPYLSCKVDHHRAGVVDAERRRVLNAMQLERAVERMEEVVRLIDDAP
jgi:hypothetical protein